MPESLSSESPELPESPAFLSGSHTQANLRRDFYAWHRGRPHFALWALMLDTPAVAARVTAAQQRLAPFLLAGYARAPHVTLAVCGFPAPAPQSEEEFGPDDLARQLARLRALGVAPFTLRIGRVLRSFASAPYLSVEGAEAKLQRLHAALRRPARAQHTPVYVPHLTVGLYGARWPGATVQAALAAHGVQAPLPWSVRSLRLMRYAAADIGGALSQVAAFDLASGALHAGGVPVDVQGIFAALSPTL